MANTFYDFQAKDISGKEIQMKDLEGKVVLIVNTASQCGFTPQLEGLEKLYEQYQSKGLVILGFPCNQFGNQEPGDEKSIQEGCLRNYGVSFQMFSKVEVNGRNAHPIFVFLKSKLGSIFGNRIKWNFTKFLLDKKGKPIKRFAPFTKPEKIEKYIVKLLHEN